VTGIRCYGDRHQCRCDVDCHQWFNPQTGLKSFQNKAQLIPVELCCSEISEDLKNVIKKNIKMKNLIQKRKKRFI